MHLQTYTGLGFFFQLFIVKNDSGKIKAYIQRIFFLKKYLLFPQSVKQTSENIDKYL